MSDQPADFLPTTEGRLARLGQDDVVSERRALLHRAADSVRTIIDGLSGTQLADDEIARLAEALEGVGAAFGTGDHRPTHGWSEAANSGDPHAFFDSSPVLGKANPLAAPLIPSRSAEGTIIATAVFGRAYEGPPGCVHGGYIAASFDDVLGLTQSLSGQHGMTGRLTVNYRSPTPLHEELRFEGFFDRVEGRKIFTHGTLHAGDRLCAEADAVFITVDFTALAALRPA